MVKSMRINQKEIASQLGLSGGTVSKSLRNHPGINPETRARVLEMAAQMGYRVRSDARVNRRENESMVWVGVLDATGIYEIQPTPSSRQYLSGLSRAAEQRNASIAVHLVPGDTRQLLLPSGQFNALREGVLQGLVLLHAFAPEVVAYLSGLLPCISVVHRVYDLNLDHVDVDCEGAMFRMARHLYELGHRRIAFCGFCPYLSYSQTRYAAYVQAMNRLGLRVEPPVHGREENNPQMIEQMLAMMRRAEGITAWMTPNDNTAYNLLRSFMDAGIRVPQDVSVTGFDGAPPPGLPQVTTSSVPFASMGEAAMQQILTRITDLQSPIRLILLDCPLVVGQTTAPPQN